MKMLQKSEHDPRKVEVNPLEKVTERFRIPFHPSESVISIHGANRDQLGID